MGHQNWQAAKENVRRCKKETQTDRYARWHTVTNITALTA